MFKCAGNTCLHIFLFSNSRSVISPKICHCIHPFFRNYAPVSTPSSYCIQRHKRYSVIVLYKVHIVQWTKCAHGMAPLIAREAEELSTIWQTNPSTTSSSTIFPPPGTGGVPQPDVSTKELIIIIFMFCFWAYSLFLTYRSSCSVYFLLLLLLFLDNA